MSTYWLRSGTLLLRRRLALPVAVAVSVLFNLAAPVATAATAKDKTLVFAAASLTEVLKEVAEAYAANGHEKPVLSFAASSVLARQIENGAPAGLFISADEQWMDYLADRKLIDPASRVSLLGNKLVLVAPAGAPLQLEFFYGFPLASALGQSRLAMGDPESVPAGKYGKAALENLGVWNSVAGKVARADSVRTALAFVERGEAAAGIVYATDAKVSKKVSVIGEFPQASYPMISYPLALIADNKTPAARDFRAFLLSPAAKAIFTRYGFIVK